MRGFVCATETAFHQLADYPVWAFGSLVNGPCKAFSDLDLAIISQQPLPLNLMAAVAEAFSDSDLPYKVDLLDWATTSADFRTRVQAKRVVVQEQLVTVSPKAGT